MNDDLRPPPRRHGQRASRRFGMPLSVVLALSTAVAQAQRSADPTAMSLEQLLQVSIVGASKYEQKQSDVAAAVSVITRSEIKAFGWRTIDQALASLPGVYTTYDRQYVYLGTRGFGLPGDYNTRVLVTVNGNRQNEPIYDSGPFGRQFPLDIDLIERIEFIPGPGGAVYGQNAMFGVVNIVTRDGAGLDGAELVAAYQSPQSLREGRASWGQRLDNGLDLLLSVSALRARGEDRFFDYGASGISGTAVGLDGERDQEFFGRIARGPWSFDYVYGDHRKDDPTAVFLSDPLVPGQYQGDAYSLAQLQYQDNFADDSLNVLARLFAGRYQFSSVLSYTTPFGFPAKSNWEGAELRLLYTAVKDHKLMLGLELQNNRRETQYALDLANPANNLSIATPGSRSGLYGQDEWRLTETLSATLGLRIDHNNVTGSSTSPRAGLIWQASAATTMKALYGRASRAPNAYERNYADGMAQVANLALGGERIDTFELVADHRVSSDLTLRGSLYEWDMHDLITLGIDPVSGLPQYQSGTKVVAHGLELSADKTWGNGARLRCSASLQGVGYGGGGALLNSPKGLGKLNASAPLPWAGLHAGYELRYDSPRLTLDGSRLGGYTVSNLHLSTAALARGLELSLTIGNVFDKRYAHPGSDTNWQNALEQDGRSIRAQLAYRL